MPNAFAPHAMIEKNKTFKPSFAFISADKYYFAVFDRWGIPIFETTDYKIGWTGRTTTNIYPSGVYIYRLQYSSSYGRKFEETGTFKLID